MCMEVEWYAYVWFWSVGSGAQCCGAVLSGGLLSEKPCVCVCVPYPEVSLVLSVFLLPVVTVVLSSSPGCSSFSPGPLHGLCLWRERGEERKRRETSESLCPSWTLCLHVLHSGIALLRL